ncbi:MAG: hybrid sensor histidine kinase/response regulator, partial [Myxococcaceae bacterium]
MNRSQAVEALALLVEKDPRHVVRLWSKRLRDELPGYGPAGHELQAPLTSMLTELGRLLCQRGEQAVRLWPESIRAQGLP